MSKSILHVGCTLEIEQTHESFHAHVVLDEEISIYPGDQVTVQGGPIRMTFGEKRTERRVAIVRRAGFLRRAWTRLAARFELDELYDVSFTPQRLL